MASSIDGCQCVWEAWLHDPDPTPTVTTATASATTRRGLPALGQECCSSVTGGVLGQDEAERLARSFKALGDPTRVRLLSLIAASQGGEACICDMTDVVGLAQPTVSHHMRQLVEAGIVTRQQRGKWAYYAIARDALNALGISLTTTS